MQAETREVLQIPLDNISSSSTTSAKLDGCFFPASESQNATTGKINVERLQELIPLVQGGALKLVPIEGWDPKTRATHRRNKRQVSEGSSAASGTTLSYNFVNDDDKWSVRLSPVLFCCSQLPLIRIWGSNL